MKLEFCFHRRVGFIAKTKIAKSVTTFVKRAMNSPQLAYSLMFEPVDPEMEHERFRSKQLLKQSIKEILAEGKVNGEFEFEDLNTAALGVVGAMTFVVIEPLNPSRNVMFDQNYKDHFVKQIADFVLTQYIDRREIQQHRHTKQAHRQGRRSHKTISKVENQNYKESRRSIQ